MAPILVTGFKPFGPHLFNPSSRAAAAATETLGEYARVERQILPVSFKKAEAFFDELDFNPAMSLHFGLGACANQIRIEKQAKNKRGSDQQGENPSTPETSIKLVEDSPDELTTEFPASQIKSYLSEAGLRESTGIEIIQSTDAGNYVCNALYYFSLMNQQNSVFIHLPKTCQLTSRLIGQHVAHFVH